MCFDRRLGLRASRAAYLEASVTLRSSTDLDDVGEGGVLSDSSALARAPFTTRAVVRQDWPSGHRLSCRSRVRLRSSWLTAKILLASGLVVPSQRPRGRSGRRELLRSARPFGSAEAYWSHIGVFGLFRVFAPTSRER